MNNIELENKIKELVKIENYFDLIDATWAFEKEYKNSDFYKKHKMPLAQVIREARIHYGLSLVNIGSSIQKMLNSLDITHFSKLLDQIGETFGLENEEISKQLEVFKDLNS